jgi:hypothetical protein
VWSGASTQRRPPNGSRRCAHGIRIPLAPRGCALGTRCCARCARTEEPPFAHPYCDALAGGGV